MCVLQERERERRWNNQRGEGIQRAKEFRMVEEREIKSDQIKSNRIKSDQIESNRMAIEG